MPRKHRNTKAHEILFRQFFFGSGLTHATKKQFKSKMNLIIYSPETSARLKYTLDLVFQTLLPLEYELTRDIRYFQNSGLPKINYSKKQLSRKELCIPMGHILFEKNIYPQQILVFEANGLKAFFRSDMPEADLPFDFFGMVFYLASRYEEYTAIQKDKHNRFPASASLAFQNQFLNQPLINEWALVLLQKLQEKFPSLICRLPEYEFSPSYDVDLAWAYLNRSRWRSTGAVVKMILKGQFPQLRSRQAVLQGQAKDPFFTFPDLNKLHKRYGLKPKYFFLLGDYGPFDKNISHRQPALQQLIRDLAVQADFIGIHPSYRSNSDTEKILIEKNRLESILNRPVYHSRQHFLKLEFPETYRQLLKAGIKHDFTMGYAAQIGFRASLATPFRWYDLEKEKATALIIHPFQVMDVTLKQYLKLEAQQAIDRIEPIINACQKVGGQFCTLWHNSSFSEIENWAPWKAIYEKLLDLASKKPIIF